MRFACSAFVILWCLLLPRLVSAQATTSRVEVGADAMMFNVPYTPSAAGLSGRFNVNLTPALAIESRASWFRWPFGAGSGLHVTSGVRATLVRGRRVSLYGLAQMGWFRRPRLGLPGPEVLLLPTDPPGAIQFVTVQTRRPSTNFVLDMGLGVQLASTSRWLARIEINRDLHARRGAAATLLSPSGSPVQVRFPEPIGGAWNVHAGVSYRLGSILAAAEERPGLPAGRWTVGPQVGFTVSTSAAVNSAVGAFASYRLTQWCDVEGSASSFLRDTLQPSPYEGGRVVQAVGGVKIGVRERRIGVFFKVRGGVNRDSKVFRLDADPGFRSLTIPVLDLGGVVETYWPGRTVLRLDIGETLAFTPRLEGLFGATGHVEDSPKIYGLPMRIGFGWRF